MAGIITENVIALYKLQHVFSLLIQLISVTAVTKTLHWK